MCCVIVNTSGFCNIKLFMEQSTQQRVLVRECVGLMHLLVCGDLMMMMSVNVI